MAAIALAVLGAVLRMPALVALGVVGWLGAVAIESIKASSKQRGGDQAQGQAVLRPVQRLHREIERLVTENPDNPTVRVIGSDALKESSELVKRATSLDILIKETRFADDAVANAKEDLASLQERLAASDNERQRESFLLAIQARENEIAHYARIKETIVGAQARLQEAEAALTAIKGQLAAAVAGGATDDLAEDGLDGMVGRLKSLSSSLEEVEQMRERIP
jgi:hypothetical protein